MNIFFLDCDAAMAAKYHNDRHCVKMILETAQLLSTACHEHGVVHPDLYKPTHKNHPSAIWVRESRNHYDWALLLMWHLCQEYTERYGKVHKCASKLTMFALFSVAIPNQGWLRSPPQCMPDDCKGVNTVEAYRKYYMTHKRHIAQWKTGVTPAWWK